MMMMYLVLDLFLLDFDLAIGFGEKLGEDFKSELDLILDFCNVVYVLTFRIHF